MSATVELEGMTEFRREVAAFLEEFWSGGRGHEDLAGFHKEAIERGYMFRYVPKVYGGSGQDADPVKAHIISEEFERVGASLRMTGSMRQILPTLLVHGTEEQKRRFIPPTLSGEIFWCQGYSEPGAGSDLGNVQTKAVLEGDEWVINGQKIWTSRAHKANHIFLLARSEPDKPKYENISYLLMDMRQPGVTVRPLKQLTGESEFNEVFFDNARTPKDWIVGERGKGWAVSRTTLDFERAAVGSTDATAVLFSKLTRLARTTSLGGRPAIEDAFIRDELLRIHSLIEAQKAEFEEETQRSLAGKKGSPASGAFAKLYSSKLAERMALVAQRIMGDAAIGHLATGAPGASRWLNQFMNSIAAQIGGGSSNMQRNVIAEKHLSLPRDIRGPA
jgi:alkylation response protein AidB-like acyl-CoA dehydrogenase